MFISAVLLCIILWVSTGIDSLLESASSTFSYTHQRRAGTSRRLCHALAGTQFAQIMYTVIVINNVLTEMMAWPIDIHEPSSHKSF